MVDKLQFPQLVQAFWTINSTVDAINPAPVDMVNIPCTYKVLAPSFRWLFLRISLPINRMGYSPYPLVRCFQQLQPSLQVTKEVSIAPFPSPPDRYLTWKVRNIHRYLGKKKTHSINVWNPWVCFITSINIVHFWMWVSYLFAYHKIILFGCRFQWNSYWDVVVPAYIQVKTPSARHKFCNFLLGWSFQMRNFTKLPEIPDKILLMVQKSGDHQFNGDININQKNIHRHHHHHHHHHHEIQ